MRTSRARIVMALGMVAILSGLSCDALAAAPSCAASCVERMHACRAERCPAATGSDRRHCRDVCCAVTGCAAGAARTRTIATVVNECHAGGGMYTARQRLEIRRGDCPPVTVMTIEGNGAAPDPLRICQLYGQVRDGWSALSLGVFQGLAVSTDGETVLFQVTDDFVGRLAIGDITIATPGFTVPREGIYVVDTGSPEPRWIADQSREAPFAVVPTSAFPFVQINVRFSNGFSFSPDGKTVVLVDHGPGADGSDAPQIFTLDPRDGTHRQLTNFTASSVGINPGGFSMDAFFLDDEQIGGFVYDRVEGNHILRIRRDGSDLRYEDVARMAPPGAMLVQVFRLAGVFNDVFSLALPTHTEQPSGGRVREIFVPSGHDNVLQLTNLGRSDTTFPLRSRDREHVFFLASGDPLRGANPSLTCQVFSIDVFGGHLRQLTSFNPGATSPGGCVLPTVEGCTVGDVRHDPATGAILFDSSCDPFGLHGVGEQVFAVRPDGSGFRQLSDYRGMTTDVDGAVSVELPGPIAYQSLLK